MEEMLKVGTSATLYKLHADPTSFCLYYGDEEYEGLNAYYSFVDGVLRDGDGDVVELVGQVQEMSTPEVDKEVMRMRFDTISEGGYKQKLYDLFGKERTEQEIDDYLSFDFFKRSGGGIGMTRLIRSMKLEGLVPTNCCTKCDKKE